MANEPSDDETFGEVEDRIDDRLAVFRVMEQELEALVGKYRISPNDLKNLLEVVMALSETMDHSYNQLGELSRQKREIEEMWVAEKNKWRLAEKSKLELECEYDNERAQFISEKRRLEGQKADVEARLKQTKLQKQEIESELLLLKDKIAHDERTRRNLTQQYRNQFENIRTTSIKRATARKRQRWKYSKPPPQDQSGPTLEHRPEVSEPSVKDASSAEDNPESLPIPSTLDGEGLGWQDENSLLDEQSALLCIQPVPTPENLDGITLYEELVSALDPAALGASKADLQMLLKEKEQWDRERSELVREGQQFRDQKETLESENTRLRIEVENLQQTEKSLHQKLLDVRKEADTVLSAYFNQPYKDFCITQVELLNLLKMNQSAQIQLESEREEKRRLKQQLEEKRTWFDRFRTKIKTALSKDRPTPEEDGSSDFERSNEIPAKTDISPLTIKPTAQRQSTHCSYTAVKDWLLTKTSFVSCDALPVWMGQIQLSGIGIRRIDCAAVGKIAKSLSKDTHTHSMKKKNASLEPRGHTPSPGSEVTKDPLESPRRAEVWVATSDEFSAYIEIVNILGKARKVRQRFLVKPSTQKVQCMSTVPGYVEPSQEYVKYQSLDLSWVEDTYSPKAQLHNGIAVADDENRFSKSEESKLRTSLGSDAEYTPEGSTDCDESVPTGASPSDKKATGRVCLRKKMCVRKKAIDSIMWLITTDGRLCFYPTSDPSHVLINSVQLCQRAFCLLYVEGKVFMGHVGALVTVYCKLSGTWILDSPRKLHLSTSSSSSTPTPSDDVRCITEVGKLVWIGCGSSIYFVDAKTLEVKGSTAIPDGVLDRIVVSGSVAIASALNGSTLFMYNIESTKLVMSFNLSSLASMVDTPPDQLHISTTIADELAIYVGTSNGKIAVIPTASSEIAADMDQCTVSVHGHLGDACLLRVPLPPAWSSTSEQPEPGQSLQCAATRGKEGNTMIISAGMGHCTAGVGQSTSQICDQGYCVMMWGFPSTIIKSY